MLAPIFIMLVISILHHMAFIHKNEVVYDTYHAANVSSCYLPRESYDAITIIEPAMSFFTVFTTFIAWLALNNIDIKIIKHHLVNKGFVYLIVRIAVAIYFTGYIMTVFFMTWIMTECQGLLFNWYIAVFLSKTVYVYTMLLEHHTKVYVETEEEEKFKNYFN